MTRSGAKTPFVAIACGGTGGHLFPGLAVAGELKKRGCRTALLISPKDIDQQAVKAAGDMEIFTLPAVGLQNRNYFSFAGSFVKVAVCRAEDFSPMPTRRGPGDGRVHQRAAGFGGERFGRENFLARVQYHSRSGQSLSRAFRGRGVCRISRNRCAVENAKSHSDRHAGSPAIFDRRSAPGTRQLPCRARS